MVLLNLFHRYIATSVFVVVVSIAPAYAGVIPLFNPSSSKKYHHSFSLKVNTYLANDSFTLKDLLLNEMKGDEHIQSGDNVALAIGRFDLGYGDEKYGYIGYTYREEIFLKASQDTVELIYEATNKVDLEVGKYYDLYLLLKAYEMHGMTYANSLQIKKNAWNITLGVAIEALYAKNMQDGYISGYAVANSEKDYSFSGVSHYNYTHNYLYDLTVNPSDAYGYATHFSLALEKGDFHFLLLANDLFSKLYWSALPYSDVYLSSDNKEYDEDGYVKYKPLLHGQEGYRKYKQSLMQKYRAEASYNYNSNVVYTLGSDYIEGIYLPYIACKYSWQDDVSVKVGYENRFGGFSLEGEYKNFTLAFNADDIFSPSALGVSIAVYF
jgi:hypothetical protein